MIEAGGGGGTLALLMEGYRADAMICTEPHDLKITISHVGINYFRVRVQGKTSHAGLAHLGVNAIGKMFPIYQALIDLDEKRGREVLYAVEGRRIEEARRFLDAMSARWDRAIDRLREMVEEQPASKSSKHVRR